MNSAGSPYVVSYHVGDSACEELPAGNGENGASEPCNVDLTPINNDIDNLQERTKNVTLPVIQGETVYDGVLQCNDVFTSYIPTGLEDFAKTVQQEQTTQTTSINTANINIGTNQTLLNDLSNDIVNIQSEQNDQKNTDDNLQGQITVLDTALSSAQSDFPTLSQQQSVENQLQSINYFLQSLNFSSAGQNLLAATAMDSVLNVDSSENTIILGHCNQDSKPCRMVLHGECSGTPNGSNFDGTTDSELWFSRGYNITEPHQWEESTLQQSYRFGHSIVSNSQKFELTEKLGGNTGGDNGSDEKKLMSFSTNELTGFNNRFSVYTNTVSLIGNKIFLGTAVESLQERLRKLERQISGYDYLPVEDPDSENKIIPPYVGWLSNQVTVDGITYETGGASNTNDAKLAFSTGSFNYTSVQSYNNSYGSPNAIQKVNGNNGDWFWIKMDKKVQIGSVKIGSISNFRSWSLYKEKDTTIETNSEVFSAELLFNVDNSGVNAKKGCGYYSIPLATIEANEKIYIQVNSIMAGESPPTFIAKGIFFEGKFV